MALVGIGEYYSLVVCACHNVFARGCRHGRSTVFGRSYKVIMSSGTGFLDGSQTV